VVIVGSLLLILVAVAMLGLGLVRGSNAYLVGSIAASLLAAVALIVGARRSATVRAADNDAFDGLGDEPIGRPARPVSPGRDRGRRRTDPGTVYGTEQPAAEPGTVLVEDAPAEPATAPTRQPGEQPATAPGEQPTNGQSVELDLDVDLDEPDDEEDPPDEPAAQLVSPVDAAGVARLSTHVLVVDGRPRYHLAGCVHLLGRESERLPVSEAVELGFTPCGLCEPDSALLAEARRA
jgi:hypothetical protein